jgi:hypothetical protein
MYKEKIENGIFKDFGIVFEKSYEFVDAGSCEAGVCIGGVAEVGEGCVAVERFFS